MSIFQAPLTTFKLEKHPNADSLSIARIDVADWQCIVKTEEFENENLAVYIPLDAIADKEHPLLNFLDGKRVKTCRLRGELSQGVLLPYSKVKNFLIETLRFSDSSIEKVSIVGKDFSPILKIKRWFEEVKIRMGTDQETPHPKFDKYSDIENIKNFPDTIGFGESVQITEKLHGTSARFSLIDDIFMIGSRKCQLKIDVENKSLWHLVFETHDLKTKLLEIKNTFNSDDVAIYGEIVGQNIQDLNYGFKEPTLFVYDIKVNGKFLPTKDCFELTQKLNLKHVPVLTTCYFENSLKDLRLGISTLADHVREGIVIKPIISRNDPKMGRVIIKVISEDFLMRKNQKDLNYD